MATARDRRVSKAYSAPRDIRRDEHGRADIADVAPSLYCEQCGTGADSAYAISYYTRGDLFIGAYCEPCISGYLFGPVSTSNAWHGNGTVGQRNGCGCTACIYR
jgi:hypothetical protein